MDYPIEARRVDPVIVNWIPSSISIEAKMKCKDGVKLDKCLYFARNLKKQFAEHESDMRCPLMLNGFKWL